MAAVIQCNGVKPVLNRLLLVLTVIAFPLTALCQDSAEQTPANLLGFLKPKMRVGIQFRPGTTNVNLSILDAEEYAVALDIASSNGDFVNAESLAIKYEIVRARLEAHTSTLGKTGSDESHNPIRVYPLRGYFFGTVRSVGEDFVLIEYLQHTSKDAKNVRVALNKTSIARIYLDLDPIVFTSP